MLISPTSGHIHLTNSIILEPGTAYDTLKQLLTKANINFSFEDSYGLYQSIYLNNILTENKKFSIELQFEKFRLRGLLVDFTCNVGHEITLEQWVADLKKNNTTHWGNIKTEIHPRFDVPLVSIKYI